MADERKVVSIWIPPFVSPMCALGLARLRHVILSPKSNQFNHASVKGTTVRRPQEMRYNIQEEFVGLQMSVEGCTTPSLEQARGLCCLSASVGACLCRVAVDDPRVPRRPQSPHIIDVNIIQAAATRYL